MDDFKDRTINELVESYPIFVDALKEEYGVLMNIIDIVLSGCGIMSKIEIPGRLGPHGKDIFCEAFDCFFEYQIYKITEKYRYYKKIRDQAELVEQILIRRNRLDLIINFDIQDIRLFKYMYVSYHPNDKTIEFWLGETVYVIKVEEKYQQDMALLFKNIDNYYLQ